MSSAPTSIADLRDCAEKHLTHFVNASGARSFQTYDRQGDSAVFGPLDALAPALLDVTVTRTCVNQMFSGVEDNAYNKLKATIEKCLGELALITKQSGEALDFADADLSGAEGRGHS